MDFFSEIDTAALPHGTLVMAVRGREVISSPYRFDVFASVPGAAFDETKGIGEAATIAARIGEHSLRWHGVVSEIERIDEVDTARLLVRVRVVPRLAGLALGRHGRVFTKMTVQDVVVEVLRSAGLDDASFAFRLRASYEPEEHVCQYGESDLAFIERVLGHDGISYYFEHGEDAEKVVFVDAPSGHTPSRTKAIRYYPQVTRDAIAGECFRALSCHKQLVASSFSVRDYDYARPALDVSGSAEPGGTTAPVAVVEHGARVFTPDRAKRVATIRAEEASARQTTYEARGTAIGLAAGFLFDVEDHPRAALNTRYLCTDLDQVLVLWASTAETRRIVGVTGDEVYEVRAGAILAATPYRPIRKGTGRRVPGMESARIDGPGESPYAQLDDDGRYQVKFLFDETTRADGKASTEVRMMQPHAGNPEGFHLPARKGTEVVVGFLGGDPDRPVIAGVVPNGDQPSVVTSQNHTRNIAHTGSDNHLEIEDLEGSQWFDLRTPPKNTFMHLGKPHDADTHNIVLNTEGDCLFEIGGNQDISVGHDLTEKVKLAVVEKYNTSQTTEITSTQTTIVEAAVEEQYSGGHWTTTTGPVLEIYGSGQKTTVSGGERQERYNVGQTTVVSADVRQTFKASQDVTLTGPSVQAYNANKTALAVGQTSFHYDGSVIQLYSGNVTRISGPTTWNIPGGATIVCPNWSLTQTKRGVCHDVLTEFIMMHAQGTMVSVTLGGINLSASAVAANSRTVSVSRSAASISVAALNLTVTAIKISFNFQELVCRAVIAALG